MQLELIANAGGKSRSRTVPIHSLVIGGWTGRDPKSVAHHIEELKAIGVTPPTHIPCFYRCSASLLTTRAKFEVLGGDTSGEVEFVLLMLDDGLWVTVGSDHTDRKVESYSVAVSKQICHKAIAALLWRFADVEDHWDRLILRSRIDENDRSVLYQEGGVTAMLHPANLMEAYRRAGGEIRVGTVLFGGTLPVRGNIRPTRRFICELDDPVLGQKIEHTYETEYLPVV